MKRGKKLLMYLFTVAMCSLASYFFNAQNALAANIFTCIDKDTGNNCSNVPDVNNDNHVTTNGYFIVSRYDVAEGTTDLVFPSTHSDGTFDFPVVEIAKEAIVLTDTEGREITDPDKLNEAKLVLKKLILPEHLEILNDHSLNNIASIEGFKFPSKLHTVGSKIFDDGAVIGTIELDHYEVVLHDGVGISRPPILFENDSFINANVEMILCVDGATDPANDIYSSFASSTVGGARLTVAVRYIFYKSEQDMNNSFSADVTPIDELDFYVGDKMENLPQLEVKSAQNPDGYPSGMIHKGWWTGTTELTTDSTVVFDVKVNSYKVYPVFDMEDFAFKVYPQKDEATGKVSATYTSSKSLITLQATDFVHKLTLESGFSYSINWYKLTDGQWIKVGDVDEPLELGYVSQSGEYRSTVEYSYTYEGKPYKKEAHIYTTVEIIPSFLYVEVLEVESEYGTYLTDADLEVRTNGLLGNDEIVSKSFIYHKSGNIAAGVYLNELKSVVHLIQNNLNEDVTSNYNIIYLHGKHTVTKKDLGAIPYNETHDFEFGEDTTVTYSLPADLVYNGTISNEIKITLSRIPGINVGIYAFDGIEFIDNPNYTAEFDLANSIGKVSITQKRVAAKIDKLSYNDTYDGKVKDVNIYYEDVNHVKVSLPVEFEKEDYETKQVVKTEVKNAGTYEVIVKSVKDPNYMVINMTGLSFEIKQALEIPVIDPEQTFVYSGERINPVVNLKNEEQTPRFRCKNAQGAEGDYCKNAGYYTVIVEFDATENYRFYSTVNGNPLTLTISQYSINLAPKQFNVYYGETPLLREEMTVKGEKLIVEYTTTATSASNIGVYPILTTVNIYKEDGSYLHPNYTGKILESECSQKVNVIARPLELYYNGHTNLVYDGTEKDVDAYLIDAITGEIVRGIDINVDVDEIDEEKGEKVKNAGTYHAVASIIDPRYEIINNTLIEFKISKGTIDVSNLKLESKKYVLNFKKHAIEIEGNVPAGVNGIRYTINGKDGNTASMGFENVVVAHFDVDLDNYNPVEEISAILYIDMSWLVVVIIILVIGAGVGICGALLYASYRREHPRKIKLKIKTLSTEDLAAKRVATSVKEVLGDEEEKQRLDEEIAYLEDENDLDDDAVDSKTFIERIYAANSELKYYYSEVKNELLSYEGISHSVDRKYEVFYHGTRQVAKLSICNGILRLYVNLDPQKYDKRQYNQKDMSKFECHEKTPLRINVNSLETLRHAKVFIRIIRKKEKLESVSGFVRIDYEKFYTLKENFIPKLFKNMFTKEDKKSKKK